MTKKLTVCLTALAALGMATAAMAAQEAVTPEAAPTSMGTYYDRMAGEMNLTAEQQAAWRRYTDSRAKMAAEHAQWHKTHPLPERGDRQAHYELRAAHQTFMGEQFGKMAQERAALLKTLTQAQIDYLDRNEPRGMGMGRGMGPCFDGAQRAPGRGFHHGPRHGRMHGGCQPDCPQVMPPADCPRMAQPQAQGWGPGCGWMDQRGAGCGAWGGPGHWRGHWNGGPGCQWR